jgi:hypothetical protein
VDAIGRPSDTWRETGTLRLEKWVPPPLPAGHDATKADALSLPGPTGVYARVLVKGAPDLTDAERTQLGAHSNAVILRWGWHDQQRAQDPFAAEFRVYRTRQRLDAIRGTLDAVTSAGPGAYSATLTLERAIAADAARGLRLDAGYPFEILTHTAGTAVTAQLLARIPLAGGAFAVPQTGGVLMPVRLTPDRTRAAAWDERVEVISIASATQYESQPLFDLLDLSAGHPNDEIFVGVSAADAQPYVPDQRAPLEARPGNESAIVAVPSRRRAPPPLRSI